MSDQERRVSVIIYNCIFAALFRPVTICNIISVVTTVEHMIEFYAVMMMMMKVIIR